MCNVLKTWVSLQKKFGSFVYVPSCGTLSQEHCFAQVKIKIVIKFTIISEGQTTKVREHLKTRPQLEGEG